MIKKTLLRFAELGNADAQYSVARGLRAQSGTSSCRWLRKAAEQGHANAQLALGHRYQDGEGVTSDKAEAAFWFHAAANQGVAEAQYLYATCLASGDGVTSDQEEAKRYYRSSSFRGGTDYLDEEAGVYVPTPGVRPFTLEATLHEGYDHARRVAEKRSLHARARNGCAHSQQLVGDLHARSGNLVKAALWYSRSAEQGDPDGLWKLSVCYESGEGLCKDTGMAKVYCELAAELGNRYALRRLAG